MLQVFQHNFFKLVGQWGGGVETLGQGKEQILPLESLKGMWLCLYRNLDLGYLTPKTMRINFCFKPPSL